MPKSKRSRHGHDRRRAQKSLAMATHLGPVVKSARERDRAAARDAQRQAKAALTPEQRQPVMIDGEPQLSYTIQETGLGVSARKLSSPLDRMHNRGELGDGRGQDDNERRYRAGKWLEGLWQFVHVPAVKTANLSGVCIPGDGDSSILDRKVAASQILDTVEEALGAHWSTLHRIVCLGHNAPRIGKNANRLKDFKDALDEIERRKLMRPY